MSDFKPGFGVDLSLNANEKQINSELDKVQNTVNKSTVELPVKTKISKKELINELENTIKDLDKKLESVSRQKRGPSSDRKKEYIDLYDDIIKKSEELNTTNRKFMKDFSSKYEAMINTYRKDIRALKREENHREYNAALEKQKLKKQKVEKSTSSKETKARETSSEKKAQDAVAKVKTAEKQVENAREELQTTIQKTRKAVDAVNRFKNGPPPGDSDQGKGVLTSYYTLLNGDEKSNSIVGKIGAKFLLDEAIKALEKNESDVEAKRSVEVLQDVIEDISARIKDIENIYDNRDELVTEAREKLNVAIDNLRTTHDESAAVFREVYGDLSKLPSYTDEILDRSDADWKAMQGKWITFITTIQEVSETVNRTWEDIVSDKLFFKQLKMGASRGKAGTPGADVNLGTRVSNWDDTYYGAKDGKGIPRRLFLNDKAGTYYGQSDLMNGVPITDRESRKLARRTFKRKIDKTEAENAPKSTRNLTIYEIATQKASIAISDMASKLEKLNKGIDEVTIQDVLASVNLAFKYLESTTVNELLPAIKSIINRAFGSEFNISGVLGITDGTLKGHGVNYEDKVEGLKEILAKIRKMSDENVVMLTVDAAQALARNGDIRGAEKLINSLSGTPTSTTSSGKKKGIIADNSTAGRDMKAMNDSIKATTSAINTQTQAIRTNSTIQEINDTKRNAILETDAGDGSNDQGNFNKSLNYQADLDNVAKRIHSTLGAITSGGIGGGGNIVPPGGNIPGGSGKGPVYMPVLMSIYERLVYIGNLLLNAPFLQGINVGDNYPITTSDVFEEMQETEKETSDDIVEEIKESTKQIVTELATEKTDISKTRDTARETKSKSFIDTLKNIFNLGRYDTTAKQIMSAKEERIAAIQAERQSKFGLVETGRDSTMTGDKVRADRFKRLYRGAFGRYVESPFEGLQLTKGMTINSEEITKALQKSIQKNMFEAQTGGILRNFVGSMTGYIGMPSLEKSRVQAEGLNEVMAIIRDVGLSITQAIEADETTLSGMVKSGQAVFGADGKLSKEQSTDYNTALALVTSIEARKKALEGVLVDAKYTDELITRMGGNISEIVKRLGFVAPELRDANKIIANISSGLDKNGKALKFQTRTGEILNYTFQLMSRSIGQMWKNWMVQLNPITQIKKAFSEFMSYDVKLQRTLNVVKYNIRTILRPFMEWIAQKFINIIGFVDIISTKIQEAFGKIPISLFDQVAADSEKIREELEAASNVSAGFDELHDIGSDNTGANDLLGDIYYPQLSEKWQKLATDIGDLFKGLITGDLGFGDVMAYILRILKTGLSIAFDYIGAFLTGVIWPFIKSHWGDLLAALLTIFVTSKLISSLGSILWNALFSKLTLTSMKNFLGNAIKPMSEFLGQTLYTGMNGAAISIGEVLAGITALISGTVIATTKAKELGDNWEDLSTSQKALGIGTIGLASGVAGLGALVLGATGPIALAAAGVVALTSLTIGLTRTQDGIGSVKEETKALAEAQEQANLANDLYLQSMDKLAATMEKLETVEKLTGLSGKDLDEQVKSGKLTIDEMTSSQMMVYNAYKQNEQAIKDNKDATEAKIKSDKALVLQDLELQAANAIASKSYDELKESVVSAWEEEAISAEEAGNILSRALANVNDETQRVFGESIPSEIKSCYDPEKYESAARGFTTFFSGVFKGLWKSAVETGERIKNFFGGLGFKTNLQVSGDGSISTNTIATASYAVGTNYVPSDGLAYLHQGEAVIPKKYNQPYQPNSMSAEEASYMAQMVATMKSLDATMKQGINVNGQFTQRGSDLVAVVNKTKAQTGGDLLSNVAYAR